MCGYISVRVIRPTDDSAAANKVYSPSWGNPLARGLDVLDPLSGLKPGGGVQHGKGPHSSHHRIDTGTVRSLRDLERAPKDGAAAHGGLNGQVLEASRNLPCPEAIRRLVEIGLNAEGVADKT